MHTTDFLFEGIMKTELAQDLIFGWTSTMASRVSPYMNATLLDFLRGDAIFYDDFVTPVMTTNSIGYTQNLTINTGSGNGTQPGRIIKMNGIEYPNKPFKIWNGEELVESIVTCDVRPTPFSDKEIYDGSLNQPNTDKSTVYILDAGSLQTMDLPYEGSSVICQSGTGDVCDEDYNKRNTTINGKSSTDFAEKDSCAFNLDLSGTNTPSITIDETSGFSTAFS